MKITEDMVIVFNQTLENLNCSFRLKFESGMCGNGQCNLTEEFYKVLEEFFSKRDIELSYNNDGSIFWSKDGWKDIVENMQ